MKKIIAIALALMLCVGAMSVVAFAAEGNVTIHAQMPEGSATPNLWAWNGTDNAFDTWPGQAMTLNGDYYEIEVPNWVTGMIINTDGDNDKSADITVEAGKDVWLVCTVGDDGKLVAEVYYEDPANGGTAVEQPEATTPEIPENPTYYVVGVEALCGVNWDPAAEANKMTLNADGLYEKVYENVAAGDYQLKVAMGDWSLPSWGGDGPDGNYAFTVAEAGTVTVLFDAEAQTISVEVNGAVAEQPEDTQGSDDTATEAPAADATYIVAGSAGVCGVEWDPAAEANKMTKGSDGVYSKTYSNVAAGSYSIKVTDGSWTNSWGGNGESGNYDFTLTEAGEVTVRFDPATNEVTVLIDGAVSAQTGDMSLAAVSVALLAATAGLVAIVSKKED